MLKNTIDPGTFNCHDGWVVSHVISRPWKSIAIKAVPTTTHVSDLLVKILKKCLLLCIPPVRNWLTQLWGNAAISRRRLASPHLLVFINLKKTSTRPCGWWIISALLRLSQRCSVAKLSLLYRYSHGMYSNELYALDPPHLIFTSCTHHSTFTSMNHLYSFRIPIVKK